MSTYETPSVGSVYLFSYEKRYHWMPACFVVLKIYKYSKLMNILTSEGKFDSMFYDSIIDKYEKL